MRRSPCPTTTAPVECFSIAQGARRSKPKLRPSAARAARFSLRCPVAWTNPPGWMNGSKTGEEGREGSQAAHDQKGQGRMSKNRVRNTRWVGARAEDHAAHQLQHLGYRIVERNRYFRCGEIDIIAFEEDVLCFVEVRHRADMSHGGAGRSVTHRKQRRISKAAACYLQRLTMPWPPCRFDVVALEGHPPSWRTILWRGAFEVIS